MVAKTRATDKFPFTQCYADAISCNQPKLGQVINHQVAAVVSSLDFKPKDFQLVVSNLNYLHSD